MSFPAFSRTAIARELSSIPGVVEASVNTRRNIVAADAATADCLVILLATAHICGIPVTARPPADPNVSRGLVYGGNLELKVSQILEGLESSVPVGTVEKRAERSILLHFQGPTTPPTIYLFRIRLEVKPCRPRPCNASVVDA
ncbi:hypothetical protein HPB48_026515 [Haemaphysalis longicornis]|uniref:Uncharacterized protein n=1 Tax=Haemaphysalis longicornis TaxID=44386 RepID=A0A9J6H9X9_HAELO|nr:hypothetical protein HPB48_026515 [Haemaphysalis longicornis]